MALANLTLVPYPLISDSDFFGDNLGLAEIISAQLPEHVAPRLTRRRHLATCWYSENISPQIVMSNLRGESSSSSSCRSEMEEPYDAGIDEPMRGMNDPDWDLWEEWMGWEGAGIRDYSSHINPYI
ncbi:hypothetical protein ACSBR1_024180 [Camellia fascicularis]